MQKDIFNLMLDLGDELSEIQILFKVLKDATENNDETYHIYQYAEIIADKMEILQEHLEEYNCVLCAKYPELLPERKY